MGDYHPWPDWFEDHGLRHTEWDRFKPLIVQGSTTSGLGQQESDTLPHAALQQNCTSPYFAEAEFHEQMLARP